MRLSAFAAPSVLDWLEDPLVLQSVVLTLVAVVVLWTLFSVRRALTSLEGRKQLRSYLEGVEARLAGDAEAARNLLTPVVEADPENVGARLALGDALFDLGEPAEAHRVHMEARQVFDVEAPGVELAIANDLRAAGRPADALACIDEALASWPHHVGLLETAMSLRQETGRSEEALGAGRVLFSRTRDPVLRKRLGQLAAEAGRACMRRGRRDEAEALFRESLGYDLANPIAQRGRVLLHNGERLLGTGDMSRAGEIHAALTDLFPESVCATCGAGREVAVVPETCPACTSPALPIYRESVMTAELSRPDELFDEIEENEAWFRRLAKRVAAGDEAAADELGEAGSEAVFPALEVAVEHDSRKLREVLVALGQSFPHALLAARSRYQDRSRRVLDRLRPARNADPLLAALARRLGPEPINVFRGLLHDGGALADPGLRALVLDYFVGLADASTFDEVSRCYSPVEVVRHLGSVPCEDLSQLLAAGPGQPSFLRDAVLRDPALDRPDAMALALARCDAATIEDFHALLVDRGPDAGFTIELVRLLECEGETCTRAERLLREFGPAAIEHLVARYGDPQTKSEAALRRLLVAAGPEVVPALVRCLGAAPSSVDERIAAVWRELGTPALDALADAYRGQLGWRGKLRASKNRHPRTVIARAMAGIRGSQRVLTALCESENDPELSSVLLEAIRAAEALE